MPQRYRYHMHGGAPARGITSRFGAPARKSLGTSVLLNNIQVFNFQAHVKSSSSLATSFDSVLVEPSSAGSRHTCLTVRTRPFKEDQLNAVDGPLWSATGFGPWTNPVPPVHHRPAAVGKPPSSTSPRICRRHTDLRLLQPSRHRHPP